MFLIVICHSTTNALSVDEAVQNRIVRRQNFGVVFRYIGPMFAFSDQYTHHLITKLPPRKMAAYDKLYGNFSAHVSYVNQYHDSFIESIPQYEAMKYIMRQDQRNLQHLVDTIYDLFIEVDQSVFSKRRRRKWCVFVCSNVATEADMEIIRDYNRKAGNITVENFEKLQNSVRAMASFSQVTNDKFNAIQHIITRIQQQETLFETRTNYMQYHFATYVTGLVLPTAMHLANLHSALVLLKNNILTFDILPYDQAQKIMRQIKQHVTQWPQRYLVHEHPLSLYKHSSISHFRTSSDLHIGLKVKVSPFKEPLHLFKVESFSMDISSQAHSTIVSNLPSFFAMNDIDEDYLIFHERPLLKDDYYFLPEEQHQLLSKDTVTCLTALFHDDLAKATQLCDTFLQPFSKTPALKYVGANLVLFKNIDQYQIIISPNDSTTADTNCSACLKAVPCGSKIRAKDLMVLVPNCQMDMNWTATQPDSHLLNLHAIAPLLTTELLNELSSEFNFHSPVNVSFPNFNVYEPHANQKLSDAFKTLSIPTIHLTSAINISLKKGLIFRSETDHVVYKLTEEGFAYKIKAGWESFKNWFSNYFHIFGKIITILQWCAIGYLFYRVHMIAASLMFVMRANHASALSNDGTAERLEEFFRRQGMTSPQTPLFDYQPQLSPDFHILDFLIFLAVFTIAVYLILRFTTGKLRQNKMQIFVDVIGVQDNVMVKVMTLPHHSSLYTFQAGMFVQRVFVSGRIIKQLHIVWPDLLIQHKLLSKKERLPSSVNINYYQSRRLRKILSSSFELLLFIRDGNSPNFKLAPLQGTTWQQVQNDNRSASNSEIDLLFSSLRLNDSPPQYV